MQLTRRHIYVSKLSSDVIGQVQHSWLAGSAIAPVFSEMLIKEAPAQLVQGQRRETGVSLQHLCLNNQWTSQTEVSAKTLVRCSRGIQCTVTSHVGQVGKRLRAIFQKPWMEFQFAASWMRNKLLDVTYLSLYLSGCQIKWRFLKTPHWCQRKESTN